MIAITRVSDVPCLIYWGYNPFTNHFLTSWDIQVGFLEKICSPCSPSAGFLLQSSLSSLYTVETYQMNSIPSWVFYLLKKKSLVSKNHLRIARKGRVNTIRYIWVFPKIMVPPIINFNWVFHYKPSILGYPYFCKHPYIYIYYYSYCQRLTHQMFVTIWEYCISGVMCENNILSSLLFADYLPGYFVLRGCPKLFLPNGCQLNPQGW